MATNSKIEWTEMTWNPVTGCTRVSEGCRHCYAERHTYERRHRGYAWLAARGRAIFTRDFSPWYADKHYYSRPEGGRASTRIFIRPPGGEDFGGHSSRD
jgi:protein gp37